MKDGKFLPLRWILTSPRIRTQHATHEDVVRILHKISWLQYKKGEVDADKYSSGVLKRIGLQVRTEVRPWGAGFLTTPLVKGTGTCAGDSGGGALVGLADPSGSGVRTLLLGVQAAASKPCVDNQAIFVYPQAFNDFLVRASRELGSPLLPGQALSWREY